MDTIRLLTFCVSNQTLAIPLDQVQEVIRYTSPTSVPSWTGLLHGIVDVRGMVIPILDLRLLVGNQTCQNSSKTRIIIVDMLGKSVGLVVDKVNDIIPLRSDQMVSKSALCIDKAGTILVGVANVESQLYLVIDVEKLIHEQERNLFRDICLQLNQNPPSTSGENSRRDKL